MRYDDLFHLDNRVAVVTGGAGLIGTELVRALAEAGAVAVLADTDVNKGARLAEDLSDEGLDAIFHYLDITRERSISSLVRFIDKTYGRLDIWVNSAYPRTGDWGARFEDVKPVSWQKNVEMHMNGYFKCCQQAAEYMKKQKSGSIVNFGSTYGVVGPDFGIYKGTKMTSPAAYSAIKGGVINFTRYLASYYGKYNIRVNALSPGGVYDNQPAPFVKKYIARTPLGRMAAAEDIAGAVIFLASDAARYVTGHNLMVDGGWTII
jgi:NAD(P)-dependent dehydrogenase (short-subunit alcohol dehydrogenase family)